MKKFLKILAGFLFIVAFLAVVILGRTAMRTAKVEKVEPATPVQFDDQAVLARFSKALQFPTVSYQEAGMLDKAAFEGFHKFIAEAFPKFHAACKKEVVSDYTLLFTWPGSDPSLKPALFMGHFDVVPVAESNWKHPPFGGEIHDGEVWGRGSLDDKSTVMGLLESAEKLMADGFKPKRTILFEFGHDEELGGDRGAVQVAALLAQRKIALEMVLDEGMFVVEGVVPGVKAPVAIIGIAEKGYVSLELTVKAKGGHSSQPPRHTAIGILAAAIKKLEDNPMPGGLDGPAGAFFEAVSPHMDFPTKMAFSNLWLFAPLIKRELESSAETNAAIRTSTAVTMMNAGFKDNVLPQLAQGVVNFRIHPRDSVESVIDYVRETIDDPRVEIKIMDKAPRPPSKVSRTDSEPYALLSRTIRRQFPEAIVAPMIDLGGTDARHYSDISDNIYRFQPFTMNKDTLPLLHGTDERIPVKSYLKALGFLHDIMQSAGQ